MRIEVIFCPSCQHKLRVPEDLMGHPVQCPQCQAMFLAPPPAAVTDQPALRPAEAPLRGDQEDDDDWEDEPRRGRRAAPGKVIAPAVAILLSAGGHLLLNILGAVQAGTDPDALRKQIQAFFPAPMPFDIAKMSLLACSIFALLSVLQLLGGFAMLTRRSYSLAVVAAVLSFTNCNQVCCLLSIPVGIWALIVLFQPDVRASFR